MHPAQGLTEPRQFVVASAAQQKRVAARMQEVGEGGADHLHFCLLWQM